MSADQEGKRTAEDRNGAGKTLLGQVLQATQAAGAGEQLALLPADDAAAELPDTARDPSRRGRPPGARNKATEELRAWARARFGDPGLRLMELCFRDPKELARELGGTGKHKVSAWDVQVKQAEWLGKLLPYFWALMPAEVKLQATKHLMVGLSTTPIPAGDRELAGDPLAGLLEFQRLIVAAAGQSQAEQSQEPLIIDAKSEG